MSGTACPLFLCSCVCVRVSKCSDLNQCPPPPCLKIHHHHHHLLHQRVFLPVNVSLPSRPLQTLSTPPSPPPVTTRWAIHFRSLSTRITRFSISFYLSLLFFASSMSHFCCCSCHHRHRHRTTNTFFHSSFLSFYVSLALSVLVKKKAVVAVVVVV